MDCMVKFLDFFSYDFLDVTSVEIISDPLMVIEVVNQVDVVPARHSIQNLKSRLV